MLVIIGIKALNEERNIARTIESALAAVEPFQGKVVLADSGSSDATVEIAGRYPVDIVQLANPDEKRCGAGAQLAFQAAAGAEFFYLIDGDMVLDADFLKAAVAQLTEEPRLAGVCGVVVECNSVSPQYLISQQKTDYKGGLVDRLDGGGLYRVAAIESVGYFSDRNLHAFEEFELGTRLTTRGWSLVRLGLPAVYHYGHTTGGYRLLWRRLINGYAGGAGEVLRGAVGKPHLGKVLVRLRHLHVGAITIIWWAFLGSSILSASWAVLALLLIGPWALLAWRRRSPGLGLYSITSWNVATLGLLGGLFQRRVPPGEPLAMKHLKVVAAKSRSQV